MTLYHTVLNGPAKETAMQDEYDFSRATRAQLESPSPKSPIETLEELNHKIDRILEVVEDLKLLTLEKKLDPTEPGGY